MKNSKLAWEDEEDLSYYELAYDGKVLTFGARMFKVEIRYSCDENKAQRIFRTVRKMLGVNTTQDIRDTLLAYSSGKRI